MGCGSSIDQAHSAAVAADNGGEVEESTLCAHTPVAAAAAERHSADASPRRNSDRSRRRRPSIELLEGSTNVVGPAHNHVPRNPSSSRPVRHHAVTLVADSHSQLQQMLHWRHSDFFAYPHDRPSPLPPAGEMIQGAEESWEHEERMTQLAVENLRAHEVDANGDITVNRIPSDDSAFGPHTPIVQRILSA